MKKEDAGEKTVKVLAWSGWKKKKKALFFVGNTTKAKDQLSIKK